MRSEVKRSDPQVGGPHPIRPLASWLLPSEPEFAWILGMNCLLLLLLTSSVMGLGRRVEPPCCRQDGCKLGLHVVTAVLDTCRAVAGSPAAGMACGLGGRATRLHQKVGDNTSNILTREISWKN